MTTPVQSVLAPNEMVNWILDWDGTITKRDTLDALVHIAAQQKPDSQVPEKWKYLTEAYLADYKETLRELFPDDKLPSTLREEKELLKNLEHVEKRSLDRVSGSGIFKGLTRHAIEQGAAEVVNSGQVQIREGFADLVGAVKALATRRGVELTKSGFDILSVNWSSTFIQSCLVAANVGFTEVNLPPPISNELEGVQSDMPSTGRIVPPEGSPYDATIISSRTKLERMHEIRRADRDAKASSTVYIGDSWTDLECLLAADLGICIRDEPMTGTQLKLADSLQRVGIQCPHIHNAEDTDEGGVVWARDFREIVEWMNARV